MPEVYIDELTLENFGPFYDEHTLNFRSLEGKCGILVGGKNGAGKTHLLRAMYLAIVGESGVGDLRKLEPGTDTTKFVFDKLLNRRAMSEGKDTVRLKAVISLRDAKVGSRKVEITRSIRFRPNSTPVWEHTATRSDTAGVINDEQVIHKLREAFLPRHLARFFFFDAERGQSINLGQQEIVEGVTRILGLWTYSELEDDLRQLINTKIPRVFSRNGGGTDPETLLAELNGEIITVEGTLKARKKERDFVRRNLGETETELLEVEDDLKTLGVVDPEELQKFQAQRIALADTKGKLESKLTLSWETALPVSLLGNYRRELHDYLQAEERRRDWEGARSTVEPKIPKVKTDVFAAVPAEYELAPDVESFYMKRLENSLCSLFNPAPEGMAERVFVTDRNDVSAQVRNKLTSINSSLSELSSMCVEIEQMDVQLRELDQRLKQMQQNAAAFKRGTELHEKRGRLSAERDRFTKRLREVEAEIEGMEVDLADLKRRESTQKDIVDRAEKGETLAAMATRYREAAGEIRSRAAIDMRRQISAEVGKLWVEITEREREFTGMEFDSQWQCSLLRCDRSRLSWDDVNTSAGQRQVRMLAFYEALRRLAKLVPPLVVDTPLARLDKEVRSSVLDRLYLSGHQSIILSTNAEIDPAGDLFDEVRDRLARVYTLHPHGRPDSANYEVRISSDYFGQEL